MTIDIKILNETLTNRIQYHIKKIIHDQSGIFLGMQDLDNVRKSINIIYHINRSREKTLDYISINDEKVLGKIQYPFLI